MGKRTPRLFTPPLRPLNRRTSEGYAVIEFATKVLGFTLMPWQKWLLIHAMELLPDGSLRFRYVLVLVARQNGKSSLGVILSLYWLFAKHRRLVLGTSTNLDYARETWQLAVDLAQDTPALGDVVVKTGNGKEVMTTEDGCRYRVAAANRRGGRSLTVRNLLCDELREHQKWDAWAAATNAMQAVPDAQAWCLSNAGDATSVVLNHFRNGALAAVPTPGWFIAEWSAPEGCDLDDRKGWAHANPALGITITEDVIASALAQPPEVFRTEVLCQFVESMSSAVDAEAWAACGDASGSLAGLRSKVSACVDVSPDGRHVTLAAAALLADGRARVEVAGAWDNVQDAREALPALIGRMRPKALGWFPNGPGAVLGADLLTVRGARELKATEVTAACQGFAEQVTSRRLLHDDTGLLTSHVVASSKLPSGDGWRFSRAGDGGHCDAAYAAAGAVHLARTVKSVGRQRVLLSVA